jgi:hypothetical protein
MPLAMFSECTPWAIPTAANSASAAAQVDARSYGSQDYRPGVSPVNRFCPVWVCSFSVPIQPPRR